MAKTPLLASVNTSAIDLVSKIPESGKRQGIFKRDVDAVDVHMLISAFCNFRLANRHTFQAIFGRDLTDKRARQHYRRMLGDLLLAYLTSTPGETPQPDGAAAARTRPGAQRGQTTPSRRRRRE